MKSMVVGEFQTLNINEKGISEHDIEALATASHDDIFSLLGIHQYASERFVVRAFFPDAIAVSILAIDQDVVLKEMECIDKRGIYVAFFDADESFAYRLKIIYEDCEQIIHDPYRFPPMLSDKDLYLWGEGTHERIYRWMGAHVCENADIQGTRFTVWAPNAKRVSVVGDFNLWDGRRHIMRRHIPSGVWEIFIPDVLAGAQYKFEILSNEQELLPHKGDPLAFACECPPKTASIVRAKSGYQWGDQNWLEQRSALGKVHQALSVYEVHLGSWKRNVEEGNRYLTYRELAEDLVPYVKEMGFTHIQLMPISEFPFDGSWGYQPIGLFAPTSRFGNADDFRYFVDCCHRQNLGVLIDWVPGHFPSDGHGLSRFDGTPLYEHADPRQGFHPDWSTYIYNYGRCEVASFLLSNALYWFDEFHIDGLRVDAVASMLYLDYSREDGEWIPNRQGGRENLEAIALIKRINERVYQHYPDAMMIAEESTAWPGVSHPTSENGLGFGYKWNMGWMNDSLRYMSNDPIHRRYHHHDMTFSLLYAFNENFILPLSHDEVVHGKGSLISKMPGDGWQKFANLRAYFGFMWTHPGKKLLFMGGEFAQGQEWTHSTSLDWHLLDVDFHRGVSNLVKDLNQLYCSSPSLYIRDCDSRGFEWLNADDSASSVFAFLRKGDEHSRPVIVVSNMTPVVRESYSVGVPFDGYYKEKLNTDSKIYGGSDKGNAGGVQAQAVGYHGRKYSIKLILPPLATLVFELE